MILGLVFMSFEWLGLACVVCLVNLVARVDWLSDLVCFWVWGGGFSWVLMFGCCLRCGLCT